MTLLRLHWVFLLMLLAVIRPAGAVGFEEASAPDPQGRPLRLAIWYPSDAPAASRRFGPFAQNVAIQGPILGRELPLVLLSHGAGGGAELHYDTALALAEAGFVAAALAHTGDNWQDGSISYTRRNLVERPRQLKLALDYLLSAWPGQAHIAAARVGAFGHSAGAFTVLVGMGGEPDLGLLGAFCRNHSEDWGCRRGRQRQAAIPEPAAPAPVWHHDPRIKAAVLAAPGAGYAFDRAGLVAAAAPVQLWEAEHDIVTDNRWNAEIIREALPTPPETHVVPEAGHFAFLAPCSPVLVERVPDICRDPPGFDRAAFHSEFNRAVIAFFRRQLTR